MSYRVISIEKLQAARRKPGYIEAVMAASEPFSDTHIRMTHEDFDRIRQEYAISGQLPVGPGTELKALLKTIGIVAKPNCSCNKRASLMDERGCDWCEANIEEISGWLAEEAKKRKLPYVPVAGRMLIKLAIRRARKKGNKN